MKLYLVEELFEGCLEVGDSGYFGIWMRGIKKEGDNSKFCLF